MELVELARADKDGELLVSVTGDRSRLQAVKAQSLHGASLLHHAVEAGSIKCTRMLIEKRLIDVNIADESGSTPLHRAVAEGHTAIVKVLLEHFADVAAKDSRGETALHTASYRGDIGLARLLLERGANIDAQSGIGYTPLHAAAKEHRSDFISFLICHGAKMNLTDINNQTARQLAVDEHPSFASFFDAQAVEARIQSMKKAEEMDVLRADAATFQKEAAEAKAQLGAAQQQREEALKKVVELEASSAMIKASLQEALMELAVYKAKETAAVSVPVVADLLPQLKEVEEDRKKLQAELEKTAAELNDVQTNLGRKNARLMAQLDEMSSATEHLRRENEQLATERKTVQDELQKAWQLVQHADSEKEIVQVVLKNSVDELEKNEATRKALEDRLRTTTAKVVELTGTVDALQKKVASPVQVQVLDRSPNTAAQQELAANVAQLQESYKHLKALFAQTDLALAQVGSRIDGVKEKAGKTPTIGQNSS